MVSSSSDRPTLSVGVVGAGTIASSCHLPILANTDGVTVAYVADLDERRANRLASSYGARAVGIDLDGGDGRVVVPSCDVALLAVPVEAREAYVAAFGDRSIPVFAEKPFAPDPGTHRSFEAWCEHISCNYLRLWFSSTRQLRRLVETAPFGRLTGVQFAEGGVAGPTGRSRAATERGRGMLAEVGCHGLSQLVYVLDDWELTVEDATVAYHDGYDVDVRATLLANHGDRDVDVSFEMTRVRPLDTTLRLEFEHATVEVDPEAPDGAVRLAGEAGGARPEPAGLELAFRSDERHATTFAQAAALRWREFLDEVREGSTPTGAPTTLPEVTRLVADIQSMAEGTAAGDDGSREAGRTSVGGRP